MLLGVRRAGQQVLAGRRKGHLREHQKTAPYPISLLDPNSVLIRRC